MAAGLKTGLKLPYHKFYDWTVDDKLFTYELDHLARLVPGSSHIDESARTLRNLRGFLSTLDAQHNVIEVIWDTQCPNLACITKFDLVRPEDRTKFSSPPSGTPRQPYWTPLGLLSEIKQARTEVEETKP